MKLDRMSYLQELKAADCLGRLHYTNWMLNFVREHDIQELDYVFFSDKVWFHISEYINAQNYRMGNTTKLHVPSTIKELKQRVTDETNTIPCAVFLYIFQTMLEHFRLCKGEPEDLLSAYCNH